MKVNDIFNEQLVAKKPSTSDAIKKAGVVALAIVLMGVTLVIPTLALYALPIGVAVIWGAFVIIKRFNIEYEYIFTNGELDVDKIINKAKRKKVLSIHVRRFTLVASLTDTSYQAEFDRCNQTIDVSEGEVKETTKVAIYEDDGKRVKLIFDPNEKILKGIRSYIPRKVH